MTTTPETLEKLRETLAEYGPMVNMPTRDRYAHNIVSMTLSIIAEEYGVAAANEAIDDYDLEARGWRKRDVPKEEPS